MISIFNVTPVAVSPPPGRKRIINRSSLDLLGLMEATVNPGGAVWPSSVHEITSDIPKMRVIRKPDGPTGTRVDSGYKWRGLRPLVLLTISLLLVLTAPGQNLSGEALSRALQHGGYVIVMRHASSPGEAPTAQSADPENVNRERQLDQAGRASAVAMGEALRKLKIPIGEVYTSPTYRARETARLAQLPSPKIVSELGDGGRSMQKITEEQADWLRKKAAQLPSGVDTMIVTQFPNISRAFPQWSSGLADGEALVIGSDGKGGTALIGRIPIADWPRFRP